jgi:hypothetical protein
MRVIIYALSVTEFVFKKMWFFKKLATIKEPKVSLSLSEDPVIVP